MGGFFSKPKPMLPTGKDKKKKPVFKTIYKKKEEDYLISVVNKFGQVLQYLLQEYQNQIFWKQFLFMSVIYALFVILLILVFILFGVLNMTTALKF